MKYLILSLLTVSAHAANLDSAQLLKTLHLKDSTDYDLVRGPQACASGRLFVIEDDEDHDLQLMLGGQGALVSAIGVTRLQRKEGGRLVRESATLSDGHLIGERIITSKGATETWVTDVVVSGAELRYTVKKTVAGQTKTVLTCVLKAS